MSIKHDLFRLSAHFPGWTFAYEAGDGTCDARISFTGAEEGRGIQITTDGAFVPTLHSEDEGDDFWVIHGEEAADVLVAARRAFNLKG